MKLIRYTPDHQDGCLAIFDSNTPKYFADCERQDFAEFLEQKAAHLPYFVMFKDEKIAGCGGFAIKDQEVALLWGMVSRSQHGTNLGKALLELRLAKIRQEKTKGWVKINTSQHTQGFFEKFGFVLGPVHTN